MVRMMTRVGLNTGETMTREMRKRRSAKQRAASRWWNTEAIDLGQVFTNTLQECCNGHGHGLGLEVSGCVWGGDKTFYKAQGVM